MINNLKMKCKKGQVTIFIIIAILIVASVMGYFLLKDRIKLGGMPKEILPAYNYFLSCVEDETKIASGLMGSQAGYIKVPEFSPGSEYMPFSSHLDFLGFSVPYWYYVSGNGIAKEQVPSKEKMESQLAEYLRERIKECSFEEFEAQGFVIERGEPEVNTVINEEKIQVEVEMPLTISFGEITSVQNKHSVSVNSRLGKFYNTAKKIYDTEKKNLFLENYGIDVLRLYAPVTGVEITCSPKVWLQDNVKNELKNALEANVQAIKVKGTYYTFADKENKYFVQDTGGNVNENVNFLYFKQWPTKIEIYPSEEPMIAEPVGLQEGLGILGFCYVPYHFVYDISYPVLVQIYDSGEMFQFPLAVVIDKNKPVKGLDTEALPDVVPELCEHKLTQLNVYTYNTKLEPVEAYIKYKCFDTSCDIGKTELKENDAVLSDLFPQCVNGFIIAKADGYTEKKYMMSSVNGGIADIVLDKEYKIPLELTLDGNSLGSNRAIVYFNGEKSFTIAYPEQKEITLSEGEYEVKVSVYKNSSISFAGTPTTKCINVPKSGLAGIFGATKEQCYNIDIPAQTISLAIAGGGKTKYYFVESELESNKKLTIKAESLPQPTSVEQLQDNYNLLEEKTLWLEFL